MGKTAEVDVAGAISSLKAAIQDIIHEDPFYEDDLYLLRWVIAGKMNLKKAEKKLRKAAKWRKENKISSLSLEPFPENFLESVPFFADAVTKDGAVVMTLQLGAIDIPRVFKEWGREKIILLTLQIYAHAERLVLDLNRRKFGGQPITENSVEGVLLIQDVANLSASDVASMDVIQWLTESSKKLKKYFPGVASQVIVINCTPVVDTLLKLTRSILESPTLKFTIFGPDEKAHWKDAVSAQVPMNLLREGFGGTRPTEQGLKRVTIIDKDLILSYINSL